MNHLRLFFAVAFFSYFSAGVSLAETVPAETVFTEEDNLVIVKEAEKDSGKLILFRSEERRATIYDRWSGLLVINIGNKLRYKNHDGKMKHVAVHAHAVFAENNAVSPSLLGDFSYIFWIPAESTVPGYPGCRKLIINGDPFAGGIPAIASGDWMTLVFTEKGDFVDFEQHLLPASVDAEDFLSVRSLDGTFEKPENPAKNELLLTVIPYFGSAEGEKYRKAIVKILDDTAGEEFKVATVDEFTAALEKAKDGDRLLLSPGEYVFTTTLTVNKSVRVVAEDKKDEAPAVTFDFRNGAQLCVTAGNAVFSRIKFTQNADKKLACLSVTGGSPKFRRCVITAESSTGVQVKGECNPWFYGCDIRNCQRVGIQVEERATGRFIRCGLLDNVLGINVLSGGKPYFFDCEIEGGDVGCGVGDGGRGIFRSCKIRKTSDCGFFVAHEGAPNVIYCDIGPCGRTGMEINTEGKGYFEGCTIHDIEESGVHIYGEDSDPLIRNCTIRDCGAHGITTLGGGGKGKIEYSFITDCKGAGVDVYWQSDPHVYRNVITKCRFGIQVWNSGKGRFEENKILNNEIKDLFIDRTSGRTQVISPGVQRETK